MMSLPGASWTVVIVVLLPCDGSPRARLPAAKLPAAAVGTAEGACAAAPAGSAAVFGPPDAAELDDALLEQPARNSAPPSMAATAATPATPNRVRQVRADRPCKPCTFSMPM